MNFISLIEREGLAALSLRKVAKASGVSHAAPAHYFKDLRGLLDGLDYVTDRVDALLSREQELATG